MFMKSEGLFFDPPGDLGHIYLRLYQSVAKITLHISQHLTPSKKFHQKAFAVASGISDILKRLWSDGKTMEINKILLKCHCLNSDKAEYLIRREKCAA